MLVITQRQAHPYIQLCMSTVQQILVYKHTHTHIETRRVREIKPETGTKAGSPPAAQAVRSPLQAAVTAPRFRGWWAQSRTLGSFSEDRWCHTRERGDTSLLTPRLPAAASIHYTRDRL